MDHCDYVSKMGVSPLHLPDDKFVQYLAFEHPQHANGLVMRMVRPLVVPVLCGDCAGCWQ